MVTWACKGPAFAAVQAIEYSAVGVDLKISERRSDAYQGRERRGQSGCCRPTAPKDDVKPHVHGRVASQKTKYLWCGGHRGRRRPRQQSRRHFADRCDIDADRRADHELRVSSRLNADRDRRSLHEATNGVHDEKLKRRTTISIGLHAAGRDGMEARK
jgi:hypothetical protein